MKRITVVALLFAFACYATPANSAVTFDWGTIGNPGNAPDDTGFGSVDYTYRISKHEVTNSQYTAFLNAVADTDTSGLYNESMGSTTLGGITRTGSPGSYTYSVKPDSIGNGPGGADGADYTYDNKPVILVSFLAAMRFTNWLENGQPTGAQDASTTEAGVYAIGNGTNEVRNPNAKYFIPTEDEWYKAAYYDPNAAGSSGAYYDYPTSSDLVSNNHLPSADTGNSANFRDSDLTTGESTYPTTDVGAYVLSESPYGTFDQGGNVFEWNEAVISSSRRGIRGGSWSNDSFRLHASSRDSANLRTSLGDVGFRVASIPEPSILLLATLALSGMLVRRLR